MVRVTLPLPLAVCCGQPWLASLDVDPRRPCKIISARPMTRPFLLTPYFAHVFRFAVINSTLLIYPIAAITKSFLRTSKISTLTAVTSEQVQIHIMHAKKYFTPRLQTVEVEMPAPGCRNPAERPTHQAVWAAADNQTRRVPSKFVSPPTLSSSKCSLGPGGTQPASGLNIKQDRPGFPKGAKCVLKVLYVSGI